MWSLFSRYSIRDVEKHLEKTSYSDNLQSQRSKLRIALIDDQLFFHLDGLRDQGFDIVQVGKVSSVNQMEAFDIIACDLRGVGLNLNQKLQGAAVIQELKRIYPNKFVIAYSGSFNRSNMVKIALEHSDTNIIKSSDLSTWIVTLDDAIGTMLNPIQQWNRSRTRLVELGVTAQTVAELEHAYAKSIVKGNKKGLEKFLSNLGSGEDIKPIVQGLISSALWSLVAA